MSEAAVKWESLIEVASLSDIGMRRNSNQDNFCVWYAPTLEKWDDRGHLFVVADGMGAHAAGELASKIAVDHIPHLFNKLDSLPPEDSLRRSLQDANAEIHRRGQANDDFRNMGTTCSALLLCGSGAWSAHVGDSRVYRVRNGVLEQLTFDHSLVWEMRQAGTLQETEESSGARVPRNVITRSLGPYPEVNVDLEGPFDVQPGDQFLLCSDGLTGQIEDSELGALLQVLAPAEAVRVLVDLANLRGGPDNITLIIARILSPELAVSVGGSGGPGGPRSGRIHPAVQRWVEPLLWTLLVVLLGAGWAAWSVTGLMIGAVVPAVMALVVLAFLVARMFRKPVADETLVLAGEQGNRSPYVRVDCRGTAWKTVDHLRDLVKQIRDAGAQKNWKIDEAELNRRISRAEQFAAGRDIRATLREFALAVSFVMDLLRRQGTRETGIDLPR